MNEKNAGVRTVEKDDSVEFRLDDREAVSSAEPLRADVFEREVPADIEAEQVAEKLSPAFRELALPKLPELTRENRARLQMQSPNRLHFYWSLKNNPFQLLNRALAGGTGSYTLVLKLVDLHSGWEDIHAVEPQGSWWFDVEANRRYRAEIGFYAPNRPYIRALYSNIVQTPRKSPSHRPAETADWAVSADRFSKVLQAAGFTRDAFDVAVAGDDQPTAERSARSAFLQLVGNTAVELSGISAEDLRYVLFALASGATLGSLRWRISPALFAILQQHLDGLDESKAAEIVQEQFGVDAEEIIEEEPASAVFGASRVSFPRVFRKRRNLPGYSPLSSFAIGK